MLVIPISCTDPADAFRALSGQPWSMLLDSAAPHPAHGRFSYIAAEPFRTLESLDGRAYLGGQPVAGDPFAQPAPGAGDEDRLAFEPPAHRLSPQSSC